jgi:prepilin peptidase CpaA
MALNAIPTEVVFVVLVASSLAALTDVWRFKVYNLLTLPVLLAGMIYHAVLAGWSGLALSAAGIAFGLAVFSIPYLMGGMGAGDVKFVAALGAWLGIAPLSVIVFFGCLATGIYAVTLVFSTGGLRQLWFDLQLMIHRVAAVGKLLVPDDQMERIHDWTTSSERRRRLIPFSAMIAIGVVITLVLTYTYSPRHLGGP